MDWLIDTLLYIPRLLFQWLLDAIAVVIENLPFTPFVTGLLNDIQTAWNSLPPTFHYMANLMHLDQGVSIIMTALAIRFLIKITPFIG